MVWSFWLKKKERDAPQIIGALQFPRRARGFSGQVRSTKPLSRKSDNA